MGWYRKQNWGKGENHLQYSIHAESDTTNEFHMKLNRGVGLCCWIWKKSTNGESLWRFPFQNSDFYLTKVHIVPRGDKRSSWAQIGPQSISRSPLSLRLFLSICTFGKYNRSGLDLCLTVGLISGIGVNYVFWFVWVRSTRGSQWITVYGFSKLVYRWQMLSYVWIC